MKYYFQRVIKHYILVALTSSGANITSDTHVELDAAMEDLVEVIEKTIEQAIKEVGKMGKKDVSVGGTIRLHKDAKVQKQLQGLLAVVTEVRSWGVLADIPAPGGSYPVRLGWEDFTVVES